MAAKLDVSFLKLNGNNYADWSFQVKFYLIKEKLWDEYISKVKPENAGDAWKTKDVEAQTAIVMLIEPSQFQYVQKCMTAREMWNALEDRYQPKTVTNKLSLFRKLMDMKFSDNMDQYLESIVRTCDELRAIGAVHMASDEMVKAYMLCKLPPEYDSIRNAIEMREDNEVSVTFVKSRLIEEWKMRSAREMVGNSDVVMKAVTGTRGKCFYCGKPGHQKKDCFKFKRDRETRRIPASNANNSKANSSECGANYVFVAASNKSDSSPWIIDSGATKHMCSRRKFFTVLDPSHKENVTLADDFVTSSQGIGSGTIQFKSPDGKYRTIEVKDVLYVPDLRTSLISVRVLTQKGFEVVFQQNLCRVIANGVDILVARLESSLYMIDNGGQSAAVGKTGEVDCVHGWHRRMGHRDINAIRTLFKKDLVSGITMSECTCKFECEVCLRGKFSRLPFSESKSKTVKVMDLVHTDVCGPMETETPGRKRYYLTFVDDFSKFTIVHLLRNKSEVYNRFCEYVALMLNQVGMKPRILRCDRGGEYIGENVKSFLAKEGIELQLTAPHTPQQNGVAERKNRYLTEMARCMLYDAEMPNQYWGEAILTANYIQNRMTSRKIPTTPYEIFFGIKPNLSHLRIFGQSAYVFIPKQRRRKLDEKAQKLRLIGYDQHSKAYRFVDTNTNKVTISRDSRFLEPNQIKAVGGGSVNGGDEVHLKIPFGANNGDDHCESDGEFFELSSDEMVWDTTFDGDDEQSNGEAGGASQELRRSNRTNFGVPPERLIGSMSAATSLKEPQSYKEAVEGPQSGKWIAAMGREYESIKANNTWDLTDLPNDRKAVGSKWVFKLKGDGSQDEHFKARLVARGFSQVYGYDFTDVYAPVAKNTTFRLLLSVASKQNLIVRHYDAKSAFLNANLTEEIFMKQPTGFIQPGEEAKVCRLKRSIYGLKQAARAWNETIHDEILKLDFVQSKFDKCLYVQKDELYLLIYVDDVLIAGRNPIAIEEFMTALKKKFVMKNLGNINRYLGIDVERDNNGNFTINQRKYIQQIIDGAGLGDAKVSSTPMDTGYYKLDHSDLCESNEQYRQIIGQLMYISINTRPDISACVSILARKVGNPSKADMNEVKRVLRYLKGTNDLKLRLSDTQKQESLVGFVDADWAMDAADRKSNTGYLFKYNGGLISWTSRKQTVVTLSTAEAEYNALCEACKEAVWLRNLLDEFGEQQTGPTLIYEDNQSCLKMVENGQITSRNKHMGTKLQYAKELKEEGCVEFSYCPTDTMAADILTKPLGPEKVKLMRDLICLRRH